MPGHHGRRRGSGDTVLAGGGAGWDAPAWADWIPGSPDDHGYGGHGSAPYMQVHHGGALHFVPIVVAQPNTPPQLGVAHEFGNGHVPGPSGSGRQQARSRGGTQHWGHIAFYYLTEQMHRWERFVFRFDRQFGSISALKSITGKLQRCKLVFV